MKDWYKKSWAKPCLVLTALISSAVMLLSVTVVKEFSDRFFYGGIFKFRGEKYEDSDAFTEKLNMASAEIIDKIYLEEQFETGGEFDPEKTVDVLSYADRSIDAAENGKKIGLFYSVGSLLEMETPFEGQSDIVVCGKEDGTYDYYSVMDFFGLLKSGMLYPGEEFLAYLEKAAAAYGKAEAFGWEETEDKKIEEFIQDTGSPIEIFDESGQIRYVNCWIFEYPLRSDILPPAGEASILDFVNHNPSVNGELALVYDSLVKAAEDIRSQYGAYLVSKEMERGRTNIRYVFYDNEKRKFYTNDAAFHHFRDTEQYFKNIIEHKNDFKYVAGSSKPSDFQTNTGIDAEIWQSNITVRLNGKAKDYRYAFSVDTDFPESDDFYREAEEYNKFYPAALKAAVVFPVTLILSVIAVIFLTLSAGENVDAGGIRLSAFDRWKTETAAAAGLILLVLIRLPFGELFDKNGFRFSKKFDLYFFLSFAVFLFLYMSLVRRIKAKTLWSNSILKPFIGCAAEFWSNRGITAKLVSVCAVFIIFNWICLFFLGRYFIFAAAAVDCAAVFFTAKSALKKAKIEKGIEELSAGNVDYQIPLKGLKGDVLKTAEMVNHIGSGIQKAVNEAMKSERLKTDLITNVSHDIKTPLTSIINYVDLLKKEEISDPKIQEYIRILELKAARLKTLTEDVLEASKVNSGNIVLECQNLDFVELIKQTAGEFQEKFDAGGLELICSLPSSPAVIYADGRRMWRILENILNNVVKYSMKGTRIYLDLKINGDKAAMSLKNISSQPLNISAEELTERFIRGDISRSTEGSGLGLFIAKSLTELQGGKFEIYLDGDLFKVTIEFLISQPK